MRGNPGASLLDVGDGIGCIEFHTKMNALGGDIVSFVRETLGAGSEAVRQFRGFVITNDAANFSAGANLVQLLLAAQDEEWDEIDSYIAAFQQMTQAIKFCASPVVVAPFGLALGGGAEVTLHARGAAAASGTLHGPGGDRRWADPGGRGMQGDDAAGAGVCRRRGAGGRAGFGGAASRDADYF